MANTRCLVIALASFLATAASSDRAVAQTVDVDYYAPQYYMDHLVFCDETGNPIYYDNDVAYSVPADYEDYSALRAHFEQNAEAYQRWFQEVGYSRLAYRRPIAAAGYQPLYYQDYPVYFDDAGRPIYYVDGAVNFVPAADAEFNMYVNHYRLQRARYLRWYQAAGRNYRWYRRPISTGYYNPKYYDGYVVYYDGAGVPYYYMNGGRVNIPGTYQHYNALITHYRTHRAQYGRWYQSAGPRYHGYRQPSSLRQRAINASAPQATHGRAANRAFRVRVSAPPAPQPGQPAGYPGRRGHPGYAVPAPQPGQPMPAAYPGRRGHPGYAVPAPQPGEPAGHVDCRWNPGHPACRRAAPDPQPAPQGVSAPPPSVRPGRRAR